MVRQSDVDVVVLSQPLLGLVTRQPGGGHVDQYLETVQVVGGLDAEQLVLENVQAVDVLEIAA